MISSSISPSRASRSAGGATPGRGLQITSTFTSAKVALVRRCEDHWHCAEPTALGGGGKQGDRTKPHQRHLSTAGYGLPLRPHTAPPPPPPPIPPTCGVTPLPPPLPSGVM